MVTRLMGKRAGGRDQEIHRLLPQVKKEIKLEQKGSKSQTIARLDLKAHEIAQGKRHPKAKGKGKGPKNGRKDGADEQDDASASNPEGHMITVGTLEECSNSRKRKRLESIDATVVKEGDQNKENEGIAAGEHYDSGSVDDHAALSSEDATVA